MEMINVTIDNLEIATTQLERSIELHLDQGDYISAITLAGAAEEILGKMLRERGELTELEELIAASQIIEEHLFGEKSTNKEVTTTANYYRNRMKHFSLDGPVTFSANYFSAELIDRAIYNYHKLTCELTCSMVRFNEAKNDE